MEKSDYAITALLGVMNAGKGYVPISRDMPIKRVNQIFNDIQSDTIITSRNIKSMALPKFRNVIYISVYSVVYLLNFIIVGELRRGGYWSKSI